ncbi:30S ribosome-binding factor RbfA [Candidatus Desantisbacteria bacterium]|nr:30S ribosome-binding factor RbfA [Candidatus Desantisbacteria bacterium]
MSSRRILRINELVHEEVSDIIQKKLKDPDVGFVTVSDVDVSVDLRHANIYVTVYGNEAAKVKSINGLNRARGFIRKEIGKRIKLRFTPEIYFKFDDTLERSSRIMEILKKIEDEKTIPKVIEDIND